MNLTRPLSPSAAPDLFGLLVAFLLAVLATAVSCDAPSEPDQIAPTVTIRSPLAGSSVADSVTVVITAADEQGIASVTLWIDDRSAASCAAPPWEMTWNTAGLPDSSIHTLRAEARDAAGNQGWSPELRVCVRQNHPPTARILWPPDGHWANLAQPRAEWRCQADDPDEAFLEDSCIVWSVDGYALSASGRALAPPKLTEGRHEIRVRVTDRWGRCATTDHELHAFRYPAGNTPAELLERLWLAIQSRDAETAISCLGAEFTLLPPVPGAAARRWDMARHREALQQLLELTTLARLDLSVRSVPADRFDWDGRAHAKIELRNFSILPYLQCSAPSGSPVASETWRIRASAQRLFLRAADAGTGGPGWELIGWWDLHQARGGGGEGPSWTDLLAAAREQRLCE
jgi:hypothetical protein